MKKRLLLTLGVILGIVILAYTFILMFAASRMDTSREEVFRSIEKQLEKVGEKQEAQSN